MSTLEQIVDSQLLEVRTNVWHSLLWFPQFKDTSVAVQSAVATIYYPEEGRDVSSEVIFGPVLLEPLVGNSYRLRFCSNYWKQGLYKVAFSGKYEDPPGITNIVVKEVNFEMLAATRVEYFIQQLIACLMDYPQMYLLDRNAATGLSARYWTHQDYFVYLQRALSRFNSLPPTKTEYTFDDIDADDILLTGAQSFALAARGRLEAANRLSYSDGISLTIDRVAYYQQEAEKLRIQFDKDVKYWKMLNRPQVRWVRKMWIPFKYRILAFHPLFRNIVW